MPCATAPERASAALSTSLTLRLAPAALVHLPISNAAPQAAMPPPMIRMSTSSVMTSGFPNPYSAIACSLSSITASTGHELAHVALVYALGEEHLVVGDLRRIRVRLAAIGIGRAFRGGADREFETLHGPVAELDGPHDGIRPGQRLNGGAHRHHVRVMAALDGLLRADLHAGIALPALLGLLVE